MRFFNLAWLVPAVLAIPHSDRANTVSTVKRDGITYNVFEHRATGSKLEFVKNSGICETTPGVNQYSGYLSVGENMNMWFWFFESRNDPKKAPLAAWFNGGPGCSSMIGLFQEHGPCHFVDGEKKPSLNEHSWNNYANMLYIDQPIGVGFSYGTNNVTSTVTAAPYVWKLLQAFYDQFPEYESRDFGLFTESYGGHYGPEFASYIQEQNKAIESGSVEGQKVDLVALGINNGWFDTSIQQQSYIDFAYNNSYRSLISEKQRDGYLQTLKEVCLPAVEKCTKTGTNDACREASSTCYSTVEGPIMGADDFDVYDVRRGSDDPEPPSTYSDYLADEEVKKAIGARSKYSECANAASAKFSTTGDNPRSFLSALSEVVQSGISVLVWAGDADWICNWIGNYDVANAVEFDGQDEFKGKSLKPYTVNGTEKGTFKTVDNFSFLRVYEAGHEVPYYQPEVSFQAFKQTLQKKPISST
ncbi:putative carboxypeptidase S1 [Aspergillus steynii IBT 23096]|uniref:Carboxypeptidase n=1 Tax=Aspergillus steynii IBT 23096 TaxID=1392250 RepID=A0A2I2GH72_9EURO|nr:putative carboxypeptidase S1 [Aspergillus steynii IBT 23096]PLB52231.1 putative carboxypeptidase S1 [Aspergillus steynii IBT 23096]